MGGKSKGKSQSSSQQQSTSAPLTAPEVTSYFTALNDLTRSGKNRGGRLFQFARSGTPAVEFGAPTDEQIAALGGFGATRRRDIERGRDTALEGIASDPSLTTFQAQRSRQLANQDAASGLDAVGQEVEAAITQAAFERAAKEFESDTQNAERLREDMALLAEIFFGGKGQRSTSTSTSQGTSKQSGFNIDSPFSFSFGF